MRVAILCEFSGTVRDAFIRRGHDAISCDLLPTESPGPHIEGDCFDHDWSGYDLAICHPPCTYLARSGLHWNKRIPGREAKTEEALEFVRRLLALPIPKIALENPKGRIGTAIRPYNQLIHPWMFGHDASKATCLWLKGLAPLRPTEVIRRPAWVPCEMCDEFLCTIHKCHVHECECPPIESWAKRGVNPYTDGGRYANQTPSGNNKVGEQNHRWKIRSITYQGIADAMADQWGT